MEIEGVDIESRLEVMLEDMARGVDMSAAVDGQLHLGYISQGPILHTLAKPQVLPNPIVGAIEGRHALPVLMGDVQDCSSTTTELFISGQFKRLIHNLAGAGAALAIRWWVGRGGGGEAG